MLLEILIPTYNREPFLIKNLHLLESEISKLSNQNQVRVIISDNNSSDNTIRAVQDFSTTSFLDIVLLTEDANRGLEANALKILCAATAPWVMFLGDDDYLPTGYLDFVLSSIALDDLGCIVPGSSRLYSDGSVSLVHGDELQPTFLEPGFKSVLKIAHFGHQLSGLTFLRNELMINKYINSGYRNIQLFIYFIAFNINTKKSIYAGNYTITVSHFNHRHWNFDESGLLIDNYLNYLLLYENNIFKAIICCISFTNRYTWRLRIGSVRKSIESMSHILRSTRIPLSLKVSLTVYYIFALTFNVFRKVTNKFK